MRGLIIIDPKKMCAKDCLYALRYLFPASMHGVHNDVFWAP